MAALCGGLALAALPVRAADLAQVLTERGDFTKLLAAAKAAGIDGVLHQPGPYTVFAPNDAAFAAVPPDKMAMLMDPKNKDMLGKVLNYHLVFGRVPSAGWQGKTVAVKTAIGAPVVIKDEKDPAMVNEAGFVATDVPASNGVLHVIDHVLMPAMPLAPR